MVVENYKPHIKIDPDWEMVELGTIFQKITESVLPSQLDATTINYIGLENITQNTGELSGNFECNPKEIKSTKTVFTSGDVLYGKLRPNLNKVYFAEIDGICSTDIFVLRGKSSVIPKFYCYYMLSKSFNIQVMRGIKGAQLPRVGYEFFSTIKVPLPTKVVQEEILSMIEEEMRIVRINKKFIALYEQKIKDKINEVWGVGTDSEA